MFRITALFIFCLFSTASFADSIDDLMQLSGMNDELVALHDQIGGDLAEPGTMPEATRLSLQKAMQESFAESKLKAVIIPYLRQHMDKKSTDQSLAWLSSPLGEKITALESANNSPEAQAEMQKQLPTLLKNTQRFSLIRELDKAINASDSTVNTLLGLQEAMFRGITASGPKAQAMSEEELQQMIATMKTTIRSQYEILVIGTMAYNYQTLSDNEIRQYITFAESPAGKHYHKTMMAALDNAIRLAGTSVGTTLGTLINQKNGSTKVGTSKQ